MSTDKPTKEEREASTKPGCTCVLCADRHGDQAASAEDVVIASLQREVVDLKEQLKFTTDMLKGESRDSVSIAHDLISTTGRLAALRKTVRHFLESDSAQAIHVLWEQRLRAAIGGGP